MIHKIAGTLLCGLLAAGCGRNTTDDLDAEFAGKKVRYGMLGAKVRGLDPGDLSDVYSHVVASQCYESFFQYHFLKRPYELIPALAEKMPEITPDHLIYTFKLRKDVYYIDDACFPGKVGRQVRVQDFIYAWKRIANVKFINSNWPGFQGKIVGLDEFREYTKTVKTAKDVDYNRPVEGLKALDDHTLQIKLKKPWPQILNTLADVSTAPVAREAVEYYGERFMNVAVGTGPYKLKIFEPGSKIVLVRNPKFRKEYYPTDGTDDDRRRGWLDDAGKQLPFIDGLVLYVIEEDQPYWLMFMKGKVDAAGIPKDFYSQAITPERTLTGDLASKGIDLFIQENPDLIYYGFNMQDPVLGKNLPLRRAMNLAFDRKDYIQLFGNGRGIPAKGLFPPMFKEYDPDFKNPWAQFNLDKARALMKEAEKIHGGKITLTLSSPGADTFSRQSGEYFKRTMAKIGLGIKVEYSDWPTFQHKFRTKSAQFFVMGSTASSPDGQDFLGGFYGPYESPGPNSFNYCNPKFDELYRKSEVMFEGPERTKVYREMERIVADDCPGIFVYHSLGYVPYYKYLKNYKPNAFAYGLTKYHNIDLERRKKLVGR